jgi:hypothetical protein
VAEPAFTPGPANPQPLSFGAPHIAPPFYVIFRKQPRHTHRPLALAHVPPFAAILDEGRMASLVPPPTGDDPYEAYRLWAIKQQQGK